MPCVPGTVGEVRVFNHANMNFVECFGPQTVNSLVIAGNSSAFAGINWTATTINNLDLVHNTAVGLDSLNVGVADGASVRLIDVQVPGLAMLAGITGLASLEIRNTNQLDLADLASLTTVSGNYLVTDNEFLCGAPNADDVLGQLAPAPAVVDTTLGLCASCRPPPCGVRPESARFPRPRHAPEVPR